VPLTNQAGAITLTSKPCVDTFQFYVDLLHRASVQGGQDADTTQAAYLAGKAAMIIWSSFLLDELAGLSNDARPNCPQCRADPSFLATNSGIVTAIKGPDGSHPSQFGELTCFAITKDANPDAARLVEFLTDEGYPAWLGLAPEGKVPVRTGTTNQPTGSATPGPTWRPASNTPSPCRSSTRPGCSRSSPAALTP
jgi:multiple sugar transport system substrate-binding protein